MQKQIARTCNLCEAMCGLLVTVEDGAVTDIRGDDDDVFSRGHICPKGPAMREVLEDPDRLRFPMRRTPGGGFVRVGWDEALDEAASRLAEVQARHGRHAIGAYVGNPTVHNHGALLMGQALLMALGTRNRFDANSQDANPRLFAALHVFGEVTALPVPDIDRTRYLLVLGANPAASNGSLMTLGDVRGRLRGVRERGGRVVLVDPRRTESAAYCDEHVPIRPGGDAALVLAMLHVVFAEDLADRAAIARQANGADRLAAIAATYPPERVASAIGVDAATIRRLAREMATADGAVAYSRVGVCHNEFGPIASWLVDALNVVTGNLDRPGGVMFPTPAADLAAIARHLDLHHAGRFRSRVRGLPELSGMLPAAAMAEEMETPGEGQIRGFVTLAGNPVLSVPGGDRLARALAGLEFMVSIDLYLNETTRNAHLVLPPRHALERGHYDLVFHAIAVRNTAKWSEPVVEPPPDTRDDWDILRDLSVRLLARRGLGARAARPARWLSTLLGALRPEAVIDLALRLGPYGDKLAPGGQGLTLEKLRAAPHGVDLGPLVPSFERRVRTPSGKVELAPPALTGDLERLDRWLDAPRPALVLIGRRHVRSNNSWMHNARSLVKGPDRTALLVHPADAAARGLVKGDRVAVSSRAGRVTATVEISDDVMPGVVSLPHGFGHADAKDTLRVAGAVGGPNANTVTDASSVEPLTGSSILTGVPVELERVAPPAAS
jgi:anaerobic selenocysteine-containing dehydrogenase